MQARGLGGRRNTHQPLDLQTVFTAHPGKKCRQFRRGDPGLLRLFTGIDLNQEARGPAGCCHRLAQGDGQPVAVEGFDDIEQFNGVMGLIALQGADQAQFEIGNAGAPLAPMFQRFLDAVFSEDALPSLKRRGDAFIGLPFGYCHQGYVGRIASGLLRSRAELCKQVSAACRDIRRSVHDAAI